MPTFRMAVTEKGACKTLQRILLADSLQLRSIAGLHTAPRNTPKSCRRSRQGNRFTMKSRNMAHRTMATEHVLRRECRSSSQNFATLSNGMRPLMCTCTHPLTNENVIWGCTCLRAPKLLWHARCFQCRNRKHVGSPSSWQALLQAT